MRKAYGDGPPALAGVTLAVRGGELLTVVGPSGSGKSTLLRVIAGLEAPDGGRVRVGGRDVTRTEPARRGVAMVFQSFALFPHLTVEDNIGFGLRARRTPEAERRTRVAEAAEALGLAALLARRPAQLSGGERQRVALARALAGRPAVLLLDEPLSNLDAQLRAEARAELSRVHASTGATMVHVTHDQAEALALGERVAVLHEGRLEQLGTPDEVYERPATRFVAGFVGTPPMNLLDGELRDGVVEAGPLRVPAPAGVAPGPVVLGVRPEALRPAAEGAPAVVEVAERTGHERVWHVRAGGRRLAVRPPEGVHARPGERVALAVDPAGARLFSPEDGRAL